MKLNTVLLFSALLPMNASIHSMTNENRKPRFEKDRTSLRREAMLASIEKKQLQALPARLEALYEEALPADLDLHNPDVKQTAAAAAIQEGLQELLLEYRNQIIGYPGHFQNIEASLSSFKKEKGFLIIPKISALKIETLARLYATYYAIVNAMNEFIFVGQ